MVTNVSKMLRPDMQQEFLP